MSSNDLPVEPATEGPAEALPNFLKAKATTDAPAPKRGKPSWSPSNRLTLRDVPPGMHGRWVSREYDRIAHRLDQGFVFANPETGVGNMQSVLGSNAPLGAHVRSDLVLMAIPEEMVRDYQTHVQATDKKAWDTIRRTGGSNTVNAAPGMKFRGTGKDGSAVQTIID